MAGPQPITSQPVPPRVLRKQKLSDTVAETERYVTQRAQFDQTTFQTFQRGFTDNNGQQNGGIVNAADLPSRTHVYELSSAIAPHVGDQPSQPSATTYDGPLNFGPLPTGVNPTYGYARWTGWLTIAKAGSYNFEIVSSDGANLFVNKTMLVGALTSAVPISDSFNLSLAVGVVPIVVEWQWAANPALQLLWTPPGGSQALIPATVLSNSMNKVSQYLTGYWWNGTAANWYP